MLTFTYQNSWAAVYQGDARDEAWLRRVFTYTDMTDTRHKQRLGYFPTYCTLDTSGKRMSHGQVIHAVRQARADRMAFNVVDTNHRYLVNSGPIDPNYLPGITGYDYQMLAAQIALGQGHGIVTVATGGGKTCILGMCLKAIVTMTDCPGILVLIFSKDLLNQTAKRMEAYGVPAEDIGIVHSDISPEQQRINADKRVVLSTHLSITKFDGTIERTHYVICDECFPAGTMVGDQKIEDLKVGDTVPSFDEKKGIVTVDRVVRRMQRKPTSLRTIKTSFGSVSCTDEHPFWTPSGWVVASQLNKDMFVSYENDMRFLRTGDREESEVGRTDSSLRFMHHREEEGQKRILDHPDSVPGVRLCDDGRHVAEEGKSTKAGWSFVQQEMLDRAQNQDLREISSRVQQNPLTTENAGSQPHALGRNPTQNVSNPQSDRAQTENEGRERTSATDSSAETVRRSGVRLDHGVSDQYEYHPESEGTQTRKLLQGRHSQSTRDGLDRSGRRKPLLAESPREGSQENPGFDWVRVEDIEIHEPGSDGSFGGRCPDGYVYNIETEQHHTYLANGFIVHNCHRSGANMWSSLFGKLPNLVNVLGFTATPWDTEEERQKMLAIYGQELVNIPCKFLIDRGILMRPKSYFIKLYYKDRDIKLCQAMDWREAKKQFILEDRNRNLLPIVALRKFGGRMLVIYDDLDHGEKLQELYEQQGYETRLAEGKTSTKNRAGAVEWFEKDCEEGQQGKVLLASRVFDEGIDIKGGCDIFFAIGAGKDASKTKQRMGRALRKNRTGILRTFDVQDSNHHTLSKWSSVRRGALEECGIQPETISLEDFAKLV